MRHTLAVLAPLSLILLGADCERSISGLGPAPSNTDPVVFDDALGDADFNAFLNSKLDAVQIDREQKYDGLASLEVIVPGPGDDTGWYAGGAIVARGDRDFSGYNALSFRVKAEREITLDTVGIANDNTGTSRFTAERTGIPVTQEWSEVIVPIPLPDFLTAERGLFFFAEGFEEDEGFSMWFDEIRFTNYSGVTNPRATLLPNSIFGFVGQTVGLTGTRTTFDIDGVDVTINHEPNYFTYESSDPDVAQVIDGEVVITGVGTARITAKLGDLDAGGFVDLDTTAPPADPAPTPTHPAADVRSLFSDVYEPAVEVLTFSTDWDDADLIELDLAGDEIKAYANLNFAGIDFSAPTLDASEMTHFHIDVWGPEGCAVCFIKLKLVDFGPDGAFGGGDDSESIELGKLITPNEWNSFDLDLSEFAGLTSTGNVAQLIILGDPAILYVDNIYFHK